MTRDQAAIGHAPPGAPRWPVYLYVRTSSVSL